MKSILFVCLGNICRSPLAHGYAEEFVRRNNMDIKVDSAGTSNYHIGEPPCTISQKIALEHQIDISMLKSRQVSKNDFEFFDYVIAMDSTNKIELEKMGCKNVLKIGDFGYNGADVPDPYFEKDSIRHVYDMIELCVNNFLVKRIV